MSTKVDSVLGQRRRHWATTEHTIDERLLFASMYIYVHELVTSVTVNIIHRGNESLNHEFHKRNSEYIGVERLLGFINRHFK